MNVNRSDASMTPKERTICEQITATGASPHKQRAQALLLLENGASREESVAQSGLTPNQVKYWLGRFRSLRLKIFPAELLTVVPPSTEAKTGKEKAEKNKKNKKKDKKKNKKKNKKDKKKKDKDKDKKKSKK